MRHEAPGLDMYRDVGDTFMHEGKEYKIVEATGCGDCLGLTVVSCRKVIGCCSPQSRDDGKSVRAVRTN